MRKHFTPTSFLLLIMVLLSVYQDWVIIKQRELTTDMMKDPSCMSIPTTKHLPTPPKPSPTPKRQKQEPTIPWSDREVQRQTRSI